MSNSYTTNQRSIQASIVLAALNEEKAIARMIPLLKQTLELLVGSAYEMLLIDGGSTDATRTVARECGAVVYRQVQPGYAAAICLGIRAAKGDWVFTLDADGSHPPELLPLMWQSRVGIDMVIASRRCLGGLDTRGFWRRTFSETANFIYAKSFPFGITDFTGGFRLLRREAISDLQIVARDFDIHPEIAILLFLAGGSFREIPYSFYDRSTGRSKARILRYACSYLTTLIRLRKLARQTLATIAQE